MKNIYDIDGNLLVDNSVKSRFKNLIRYFYKRDLETNTFYTMVIIPQTNYEGEKQYPFVLWDNYPLGGNKSTLEMNREKKYLFAMNGGRFASPYGQGVTLTGLPLGTVIQNGKLLQQGTNENSNSALDRTLTINVYGELGYAERTADGNELIANGIVSAVTGFIPLLVNYNKIQDIDPTITYIDNDADSQRQVLGQFGNGDYIVITTEGRGFQNSNFMTVRDVQRLCIDYGIKNAFLLDGGGSTETVIGDRQLNPFYDNVLGRVVPTYIVFNGSTEFS